MATLARRRKELSWVGTCPPLQNRFLALKARVPLGIPPANCVSQLADGLGALYAGLASDLPIAGRSSQPFVLDGKVNSLTVALHGPIIQARLLVPDSWVPTMEALIQDSLLSIPPPLR